MRLEVLRLGHRPARDKRITTHVCLTARAPFTRVIGAWLVGIALNYVPLAFHAFRLSRHGALEAELAGVDARTELRRYSRRQFVIAIPLALLVMSFLQPPRP